MTFAERVIFVLKKLYLSHSDTAKEIGVTEQTIYRCEQGLSKPHISSNGKPMSLCKKEELKFESEYKQYFE